jgi:hypothetical protein
MNKSSFRIAIAIVAIAMIAIAGTGRVTRAQNNAASPRPSWSSQNQGFVALMKQLNRQFYRGNISQEQTIQVFNLATNRRIGGDTLATLARQFKADRDFESLVKGLKTSTVSIADVGDIIDTEERCRTVASGVEYGCTFAGGASIEDCIQFADRFYCTCIGGTYDPSSRLYF